MSRKPPPLPDLDDDEFTRRLRPLEAAMLGQPSPAPVQGGLPQGGVPQGGMPQGMLPVPGSPAAGFPEGDAGALAPTGATRGRGGGEVQFRLPDIRNSGNPAQEMSGSSVQHHSLPADIRTYDNPSNGISGSSTSRNSLSEDIRKIGNPDIRNDDHPSNRHSGFADRRAEGIIGAAEHLAHIEQIRGPKRRFEYLIPARVGDALADDAARLGKSATVRLLEVLRDAGYPVIPEDLIDLRRERRR